MNADSHEKQTDSELLAKFVQDKDNVALTVLIRRYEKLVWRVCFRSLNRRDDVEDAFQITFLVLTQNAGRIRKRGSLSNWIYGVARKTCAQIRRQRRLVSLEEVAESSLRADGEIETTLEMITRQHEIDLVDQKISLMPEKHRTPLVLFYFAGLTSKQIANQLNLSVSAVEGRLKRARVKLKRELNESTCPRLDAIGTILIPSIGIRPELIAETSRRCIATVAGSKVGVSITTIDIGVKLMVCKAICFAGFTLLIVLGGYFHTGIGNHIESGVPIELASNQSLDESLESKIQSSEVGRTDGQPSLTGTDKQIPVGPPESTTGLHDHAAMIHSHIALVHDLLVAHLKHWHSK